MSDEPKCCSQCLHFKRSFIFEWGKCIAPLPWWTDELNETIHIPEHKAEDCPCFTPKP